MKQIKTKLFIALASFLFLLAVVPATKAQAATAPVPKNYKAWDQAKTTIQVAWSFDSSFKNKVKGRDYGYKITFLDMKGNVVTKISESSVKVVGSLCIGQATNSKFMTEPVKVYLQSWIKVNGKKVYSAYAKKYFVPRATLTNVSVVSGTTKARIYYYGVKGAGGYHLYLSGNGGKTFKKVSASTGTAIVSPSLTANKQYLVYVKAVNVKCGSYKFNSNEIPVTSSRAGNAAYLTLRRY